MSIWPTVELEEVARRGSGHTPNKKNPAFWNGSIQWVSLKDTFRLDRGLIEQTTSKITKAGLDNSSAVMHSRGTVILLRDAGIGKSAVLASEMAVSQHFIAWTCGPRLHNWYLYHLLQSRKLDFERISNGSTIKTIGLDYFRQMVIPLPSVSEQIAISAVATDADRQIKILERLIAKKQAIKQGMMQQLLTGRTRLPGFSDEWREVRLGEVTTWMSGGTPSRERAEHWAGDAPWISASTLKDIEVSHSDQCVSAEAVRSSSKMAPLGSTLLLVRGSALHKEIRASLVVADVCFNQDVKALVPARELRPKFLTYLIHGHAGELLKLVSSAGNTAGVLDTAVVQAFVVRIPQVTEQQRIISVFDDVNRELTALQQRLDKARNIKTGMMQQLLTGRVRLPVDIES